MLTTRTETIDYLPQREPFVAVHEIISAEAESASTQFEIPPAGIFVTEGRMTEAGLIENMAQTAAAQMGYHCTKNGLPVPTGFIASVRNLSFGELPETGDILTTTIKITNRVMDVVIFDAVVQSGDVAVCRCEMRVFVKGT